MRTASSLIVTLQPDVASLAYFNELRNKYYPRYCNQTEAHITLLHRLSPNVALLHEGMQQISRRSPMVLQVTSINSIGKGVIFKLASAELQLLHQGMQTRFKPHLISKDRKILHPHITIQNKVTAFKALQTMRLLQQQFTPFDITGTGISVWQYLNGPWQLQQYYPFDES